MNFSIKDGPPSCLKIILGYDLQTVIEGVTHYIEVKSTKGDWGETGVKYHCPTIREAMDKTRTLVVVCC